LNILKNNINQSNDIQKLKEADHQISSLKKTIHDQDSLIRQLNTHSQLVKSFRSDETIEVTKTHLNNLHKEIEDKNELIVELKQADIDSHALIQDLNKII